MTSRLDMTPEVGTGRALSLTGASVALCVGMVLGFLVVTQPAKTGQALLDLVSPDAQASSPQSDAASTPQILPSCAQLRQWDHVEYAPGDFDSPSGQNQD
jgi:hypothetical protein